MDEGGFGADQAEVPVSSAEMESHKEDRPYKCNLCDKSYRHAGSLVNHKKTHQVGLYKCLICQKEYSNPMGLKSHLRTHSEEKRFQCEQCGESFRMSQQLYNHRKSLHSFCSLANGENPSRGRKYGVRPPALVESSNLMSNLENYIAESMVPVDFPPLALKDYPEEKSQDEGTAKEEEEEVEGDEETFTEDRDELANSSTEEYRFKCNQCDKVYKHAGSLANHKQSHMVGVYQCAICYKEFSNLMAMKNHCRLHSDSRSRRRMKSPLTSARISATDSPQMQEDPPHISELSENGDRASDEEKVHTPGPQRPLKLSSKSLSLLSKSYPDETSEAFRVDSALQGCSSDYRIQEQEKKTAHDSSSHIEHETGQDQVLQQQYDGTNEEEASSGDLQTRPFRCHECGKSYRHAGSLINHKKTHQTGVYNCSLCSKQMFNMAALKNHLRAHFKSRGGRKLDDAYLHSASFSDFFPSPEDPFQCFICGKVLANEGDFLQHQLLHQEDGVKENHIDAQHREEAPESVCWQEHAQASHGSSDDSAYSSGPGRADTIKTEVEKNALQRWNEGESPAITHEIKAESTELQDESHDLDQVPQDQIFSSKEESCGLQAQSPTDRPYKCESCGRTYRHKSSLINHKLTHKTGVYQCSLCPKQYANLMALRNHVRFHSRSHTGRRGLASRRGHNFFRGRSRLSQNKTIQSVVESLNFNGETSTGSTSHVAASETTLPESPILCTCGKSFTYSEDLHAHSQICKNVASCEETPIDIKGDHAMSREDASKTDSLMDPHGKVPEASEHQGRRVYECDLCEKSYRHSGSLINHKRTHQTGDYMCPYCSKHVHNLAALKNHIRIHHKVRKSQMEQGGDNSGLLYSELCFPHDGKDLLGCVSCEETFHTEGDLLAHQMVHMQLEVDPWDQQAPESSTPKVHKDANKSLGSIDWEQSSVSDFHGEETKEDDSTDEDSKPIDYTCIECGEVYSSVEALNNHKHTHNTGIYQCSFCPKEYSNLLALRNHFQSHTKPQARRNSGRENLDGSEGDEYVDGQPSMDNSYDCGHCGLVFSNEVDFHQHQVAHEKMVMEESNVPDLQESELSFPMHSSERDLLIRIKSEMEEAGHSSNADGASLLSHICGYCGQTYDDLESLQIHSLSHGTEKEPGTSKNAQTEERFEDQTNTQQNLLLKEEETPAETSKSSENPEWRPYTCDQCGKTYRHGGSLVNHKKTHLVGNFQCVACFRQYPNLAAYRNHLRHHPDCKQQALLNNPLALQASCLNDNLYQAADCIGFNFSPPPSVTLPEATGHNVMSSNLKPYMNFEFKDNALPNTPLPKTNCQTPIRRIKNSSRRSSRRVGRRSKSTATQTCSQVKQSDSGSVDETDVEDKSIQVCEFCGTMFFGVKDLAQHLSSNCGKSSHSENTRSPPQAEHRTDGIEEPGPYQRPFRCEVCGRSYRHAGSLINHKQTHKTGVFRCSICQKRFFNLMAMKNHNRIHFELKRHKCLDCGKAFRLQKQLDTHQRIHRQRSSARKPRRRNRRSMKYRKAPGQQRSVTNVSDELPSKRTSIEDTNDAAKSSAPLKKVVDPNFRPYQCEECGRSYRHAGSLFNHKKSHKMGQYCCSVCDKTYNNLMAMKNHLRTHYKTKRHHCSQCEKSFRWKRQLLRHQHVHIQEGFQSGPHLPLETEDASVEDGHQEKSLKNAAEKTTNRTSSYEKETYSLSSDLFSSVKPVCLTCGIFFASYDELESHLCTQNHADKLSSGNEEAEEASASQEEEGRPYQCNICGRSYRHSGSLRNHKNTHETGLYNCSVCQKKFFNFMAIKNHLRIHTAEKRFQCTDCGKAFLSSRELIGHRRVHTGEKPFHCPTCNRGFSRKLNLRHHQRTAHKPAASSSSQSSLPVLPAEKTFKNHENAPSKSSENQEDPIAQERRYKCNQCDRSYRHAGSLFNHQKTHRTGVYKCPNCLKEFFNLLAFKDHLRIHKYPCKDCGKTFRIASHLAAHCKIHEQEGRLTCSPCNKHFSCQSSFDQHQLTHHRPSTDVLEPKAAAAFMVEVT